MKFRTPQTFQFTWTFLCIYTIFEILIIVNGQEKKLKISYYYESLCPDCINFDQTQLIPVYSKISDYIDLDLVPYGNARKKMNENGTYEIECQHGPSECFGNKLHACAIAKLNPKLANDFVGCSMSQKRPPDAGPYCSKILNIRKKFIKIKTCADGTEGEKLLKQNGIRTDSLNPPHTFVPWVIFNGMYNKKDLNDSLKDLLSVVCRLLTGQLPPVCNQV